ncbi:outer dense fiber protein 2-like [Polymixia lowei]
MNAREPPPVHIHVAETTPVHVHRKKSLSSPQVKEAYTKEDRGCLRSSPKSKARSPWIPPGRVSTRRDASLHKWQDAEERSGCCEKRTSKINRLMAEARSPETESELQMKEYRLLHPSECVSSHQHGTPDQNQQLLAASEGQQNVRSSVKKGGECHLDRTDQFLRALVEAEIDGVAVVNQLTALKENVDSLTKDKRLSKMDAASLGRQQDLLLEKIKMFDDTNRSLRDLFREWREDEGGSLMSSEEREGLRKRLAHSEAENTRLLTKLTSKEKEASRLAEHLDFEKDNVKTTEELSRLLDSTRNHLQSQLLVKEAEAEQLVVHIQRLQQGLGHHREEVQALQEEVRALREQREEDRKRRSPETLTLLTQQAEQAGERARQLSAQLEEKESQLAEALSSSKDWRARHSQEVTAGSQLEEEVSTLKNKVAELSSQLRSADDTYRTEREELLKQLHRVRTDHTSTKLDNQRLKASLTSSEEMLRELQSEGLDLKTLIRKYENRVEKYKTKVQQARLESEEYCLKLDVTQREAREVKASLDREVEQVRRSLLERLRELEALPERLRRTELQLREAREEAQAQETKSMETNRALSEVRHKVEQQGTRMETLQQKNLLLQEENSSLKDRTESLERKLEEMKLDNEEKAQVISTKEATIHSVEQQLEERSSECRLLSRQLDQTLEDTQRQVGDSIQKALSKERASQSKALGLESQLSIAKTELAQVQRNKEEMERRFQCQLKNMKERLEQSDSTNRSLQNYVHFLKTSYGNVFGDSLLAS